MGFTISVHTFFSDCLNTVDAVIGDFVHSAHTHFIAGHTTLITSLLTVYIIGLGYRFLTRTLPADLMTITRHFITMLCVYGLIMNWELYNRFIYNIFTNEPLYLAQVLIDANGHVNSDQSAVQALNTIFDRVVTLYLEFNEHAGLFSKDGLCFIGYGFLTIIFGTLMCVTAFIVFLYAKMVMAIFLALGPLFIICILWESTQNLFASWLRQLFTVALIPIVTAGMLSFILSIVNVTLPPLNHPIEDSLFVGIIPFLILSVVAAFIQYQVLNICAALGGGITVAGLKQFAEFVKSIAKGLKSLATPFSAYKNFQRGHSSSSSNQSNSNQSRSSS